MVADLTPVELPYAEAPPLYFRRWGLETHDDDHKNNFEIENFSGQTAIVVGQDFAATAFLSNLATIVEDDAQTHANKRLSQSPSPIVPIKSGTGRPIITCSARPTHLIDR